MLESNYQRHNLNNCTTNEESFRAKIFWIIPDLLFSMHWVEIYLNQASYNRNIVNLSHLRCVTCRQGEVSNSHSIRDFPWWGNGQDRGQTRDLLMYWSNYWCCQYQPQAGRPRCRPTEVCPPGSRNFCLLNNKRSTIYRMWKINVKTNLSLDLFLPGLPPWPRDSEGSNRGRSLES